MRMMLKFTLGLEATNEAIRSGAMEGINKTLLEATRPEAAYFATENGERTGYIFFDLSDPAQIPVIAEPLFHRVGARVQFIPVMNGEDLERGLGLAAGA